MLGPNLKTFGEACRLSITFLHVCSLFNEELVIFLFAVKVDRAKQCICVDEVLEGISVDELRESLPSHQPRYVIYSYKMEHSDGRISFPMCFIYITPRGMLFRLI
jgi:Cofilin/tropomyosin-type actin-binding protein